jgi:hypothetical protein
MSSDATGQGSLGDNDSSRVYTTYYNRDNEEPSHREGGDVDMEDA